MSRWQERNRVDWDAIDGRNGGAERRVCDTFLEMERFDYFAGVQDQGAITLELDWPCSRVGLGDAFPSGRFCGCFAGTSSISLKGAACFF